VADDPAGEAVTHVLVDLDGTISDSLHGISSSLRAAFEAVGVADPGDEAMLTLVGPPFELGLPRIGLSPEKVTGVIGAYRERYELGGLFETTMYPGVTEMLDDLAEIGMTLAVATAKPEETAVRIVEHFGITERFATTVGATFELDGPGARRTKASVIAEALLRLGIDESARRRVVMVGDRDHDVEGAIANGIECLGAGWGYGGADELLGSGAIEVCASPHDVVVAIAARAKVSSAG